MYIELLYPIAMAFPGIFATYFGKYKMLVTFSYIFVSYGIILRYLDRDFWPFDLYGPVVYFLAYFVISFFFMKKKAEST